jgi:hypothetical protein
MARLHARSLAALTVLLPLSLSVMAAAPPLAAASPVAANDVLSGTWQVTRTCLTVCVSPPPALKVVRHVRGDVYMTEGLSPQVLYRVGDQVLVHGPTDSSLLTITTPRQLMRGVGVAANGSTFRSTWRCVAPPKAAAAITMVPASGTLAQPALRSGARGMGAC